ncbi:MAG TPA: hypothetical protein VGD08_09850, partial [Stellaceae bacterium]
MQSEDESSVNRWIGIAPARVAAVRERVSKKILLAADRGCIRHVGVLSCRERKRRSGRFSSSMTTPMCGNTLPR